MTSYIIAGSSDSRETTECETLARNIKTLYSNINFIIILKHPNEWNACIKEICRHYGFKKPSNPIIFTSDGKLIGSTTDFMELAESKFGFKSHMVKDPLDHRVNQKIAEKDYDERHREKYLLELIEEKYKETLKNKKINKLTGYFEEIVDHGLVYYVKDTALIAPKMNIAEQRLLDLPVEKIPDIEVDFKEKVVEEAVPMDGIRPGSQNQGSRRDLTMISEGDKTRNEDSPNRRKAKPSSQDVSKEAIPPNADEVHDDEAKPGNTSGENPEEGAEGEQAEEVPQNYLETIEEEEPLEDVPPENPEYINVLDYVVSNIAEDYYLCLHPKPIFEGQCILVHKVDKPVPVPPPKLYEYKEEKSKLSKHDVPAGAEHLDLGISPLQTSKKTDSKFFANAIELKAADGRSITDHHFEESKNENDLDHLDNPLSPAQKQFVSEGVDEVEEEEDTSEKLFTKDFSRTGRHRMKVRKADLKEDEEEEDKIKSTQRLEEEEGQSFISRGFSDILKPLSNKEWNILYHVVRDTDSLAFIQFLPKGQKNYLQLNNEICHVIPRKFLLVEYKNAGILSKTDSAATEQEFLPFEKLILNGLAKEQEEVSSFCEIDELPFKHRLSVLDKRLKNTNFVKIYKKMFTHINNTYYNQELTEAGVNIILSADYLFVVPLTQPLYLQNNIPVFTTPMSYIGYILRPKLTQIWPQTAKIQEGDFKISPYDIVTRSNQPKSQPKEDLPVEEEEEEEEPQEEIPEVQSEQLLESQEQLEEGNIEGQEYVGDDQDNLENPLDGNDAQQTNELE